MHCTEHQAARTRLLRSFAAAALSVSALLLMPAANAQMNPPQARPQAQSPQTPLPQTQLPQTKPPAAPISDDKLNAAAAAIGQVATIRQGYENKIAAAPASDKQRLAKEANDALTKAVTDQGLSIEEYTAIIVIAQNDPQIRQKILQRLPQTNGPQPGNSPDK